MKTLVLPSWYWLFSMLTLFIIHSMPFLSSLCQWGHVSLVRIAYLYCQLILGLINNAFSTVCYIAPKGKTNVNNKLKRMQKKSVIAYSKTGTLPSIAWSKKNRKNFRAAGPSANI
jgi:uncharacterized membrane protein